MSFHVTIKPSNREFDVEPGETVLEAAMRNGITLPYGCRNGACGSCKGKVLQGQVDYGESRRPHPAGFREEARGSRCSAAPSRCPTW